MWVKLTFCSAVICDDNLLIELSRETLIEAPFLSAQEPFFMTVSEMESGAGDGLAPSLRWRAL